MTRGAGLVGLVLLLGAGPAWGEDKPAPTCPSGYEVRGQGCVHATANVDPTVTLGDGARVGPNVVILAGVTIGQGARIGTGATTAQAATTGNNAKTGKTMEIEESVKIGPGVVIKNGVTIELGAKIGRKTVIESESKIGAHVRLGARNVVKEGASVTANVRTRSRTLIMKDADAADGAALYLRLPLANRTMIEARTLRPSARTRVSQATWPITHERMWVAYCDTPTTGAFKPAPGGLRWPGDKRAEAGIGHRRVYTVCVDVDKDDNVQISASPANRWPRALSFQPLEILTRQASTTPLTIEVDGTVAMETAGVMGLDAGKIAGLDTKTEGNARTESSTHPLYHRHYTPTFKEGTVTVRVTPPSVSGAALAARTLALAAKLNEDQTYEAGQLEVLGKSLAERTDIPRDKARTLEQELAKAKENPIAVIEAIQGLTPVKTTSQPIQVEGVYNLSVFTGIGIVTGDARNSAYEIVELDGGRSLASDGSSYIDPELVLGATLYPNRKPKTWTGFDLGISTALGVVSVDEGGLEAFRSVYLGPTLGWRSLALTPALAIKKGTHLRDGNTVGMAIASSATEVDDLTESRWGLGLALMLTVPFAELNAFQKAQSAATNL